MTARELELVEQLISVKIDIELGRGERYLNQSTLDYIKQELTTPNENP